MGSLTIGNATYGRDTAGKKKLVADLTGDIKKIRNELTGKELTAVNDEISKYWTGADADRFKSKLKSAINAIDNEIKKISSDLTASFDTDSKNFAKMQSNNAETISGLR